MTPAEEAFLTELHQNLKKRAIGPDDPRYVALERLPGNVLGPDAVRLLGRTLTRTTEGSAFFLTGLQGAGKSVQLLRLKAELEQQGYAVVRIDGEDYLNLREPLDVTEFLFFLVGAISDAATDSGLIAAEAGAPSRGWSRLYEWMRHLPKRVSLTPSAEVGATAPAPAFLSAKATLKAELRRDASFVAQLRDFLDGRLSELTDEANRIVGGIADDARERWRGGAWKGLVVLVDSLDHNRSVDSDQFHKIRHALVNLLDKQRSTITLHRCRTLFTVPMYVPVSGRVSRRVTNVRVREPDGTPYQPGVDALTELLRHRIPGGDLYRLFPHDKAVERLILASGGHLRDLLILTTEVETQAESLPVGDDTITAAIEQVRNDLLPVADDQKALLRRVAEDHEMPLASQEDWTVIATLLDRHFVLGYQNGKPWYGVHPLLTGEL
jgi:hypothetical protein